jgi:hypothetical protein
MVSGSARNSLLSYYLKHVVLNTVVIVSESEMSMTLEMFVFLRDPYGRVFLLFHALEKGLLGPMCVVAQTDSHALPLPM